CLLDSDVMDNVFLWRYPGFMSVKNISLAILTGRENCLQVDSMQWHHDAAKQHN
ncbi:hypothetical protein Tco_1014306, partial [Tanacetum coccineum]